MQHAVERVDARLQPLGVLHCDRLVCFRSRQPRFERKDRLALGRRCVELARFCTLGSHALELGHELLVALFELRCLRTRRSLMVALLVERRFQWLELLCPRPLSVQFLLLAAAKVLELVGLYRTYVT